MGLEKENENLIANRKDRIRSAYRLIGKNSFYDGIITASTFLGKLLARLVWGMNAEEIAEYQARAMSGVPESFSGRLLEVPVGTGVLTMPLFQSLPDAEIVCVDYSREMIATAVDRAVRMGLANVTFRQGDVGVLPFEESSFDIVLSLNGFHVFPDKDAAYGETFRVLKSGGIFCGCLYVSGCCKRTDFFIRNFYQALQLFTPPHETMESLSSRLRSMYEEVELSHVKGVACFLCRKK